MSPMSERRETTLKESPFALSPSTKRETFHWPKYSLIVGTITTTEVNASEAVGVHAFAERSSLSGVEDERVGRRLEDVRVREHLAELEPAVAVEVRLRADVLGARAPEHALGEVEEVARLPEHACRSAASGRTARRSRDPPSPTSRRRGSRRRSRATACRRRRPRRARSTGCPRSRATSRGRGRDGRPRPGRAPVREAAALGRGVVAVRNGAEVLREPGELGGVLQEVRLDGAERGSGRLGCVRRCRGGRDGGCEQRGGNSESSDGGLHVRRTLPRFRHAR